MTRPRFRRPLRTFLLALPLCLTAMAQTQSARKTLAPSADDDADHVQERARWFLRGRVAPGKSSAELRHQAYQSKMQARRVRAALAHAAHPDSQPSPSGAGWAPLGPVPLASNASGSTFGPDYHQVSGRATAVAIDPADSSGNTLYIGGAQGGVWKSTNAATPTANSVTWKPVTDDQATLSIGAIAISNSVILAGTGEADNSADSYFGLGILRSTDGGNTWTLSSTANPGALSFSGLGAARMAFSSTNENTAVAAMAATAEGATDGALTSNTERGLYTSTDAGQTWTYDALFSGGPSESTSATSVVYNAAAGLFFAALRYHGFYSSPDGVTWTRLANQPGVAGLLSTTACPQNYSTSCPIFRGEITVVPGRNEMYVWFISLESNNNSVDEGIWQSTNSGLSWTVISDSGITNCGDLNGCGVEQGSYNLELLAVPSGAVTTDLYAGTINLYKCSISSINPTCSNAPFINLTHVYGCIPIAAPSHVHPDQHSLAYVIPSGSAMDLMYFANDGGIYRALDGFAGLTTGSCSGTNQFDDLNQNLGSMTQFVSFSEHPTNVDTLLGGTQDNGSPATITATSNSSWGNVLSGDGGYSAIDGNTGNWFASNPDFPPSSGSLDIQECTAGLNCNDGSFASVVVSSDVGGDDGAFYFPYILDPQSSSSMLLGTCRVWRGPRSGGGFTELSLNFETFGIGTCSGNEVNVVRALAAGGPTDANGSQVIYATTDGAGPSGPPVPSGGHIWVTTNATAVVGVSSTFVDVTGNGPSGSINPNQFPISAVAMDASDASGQTAYVTVMGFTGGPGHVWQTNNAGATWTDVTGSVPNALPDSPANAVVVDPTAHIVYVGTDVGVFQSLTSTPSWSEVGPSPTAGSTGFLPDVAVTALALFNFGGQKLLRASTYGRGVWQFDLVPDFAIAVSNSQLTVFAGNPGLFNGAVTAIDGYSSSVALSCLAGITAPPSPCTPSPSTVVPSSVGTKFTVTTGSVIGDYIFDVQGIGNDPNKLTHSAAVTLHVVNFGMTTPSPSTVTGHRGQPSAPVGFEVTAQGSFNQGVTVSCSLSPSVPGATCAFTPGTVVNPTSSIPVSMTATVTVPLTTNPGNYTVTLQATTPGAPAPLTTSFTLMVIITPDFILSEPTPFPNVKAGSTGTSGPIAIASQDGFSGVVNLSCVSTFGANSCSVSPTSVSIFPASVSLTINGISFAAGSYQVAVQGTSGSTTHSLAVPFNIGDYVLQGPSTLSAAPSSQATANLTITSLDSYSGSVNATCDASALSGAQCSMSPASPIPIDSGAVVTVAAFISVPSNAKPGVYNILINTEDIAGGAPSHSLTIPLTVIQSSLNLVVTQPFPPASDAGSNPTATVSVTPNFSGSVTASCTASIAGGQCSATPSPLTVGSGAPSTLTLVVTVPSDAAANLSNSYTVALTVTAQSGQFSQMKSLPLTVVQDYTLGNFSPSNQTISAGQSATFNLTMLPVGATYDGTVKMSCSNSQLFSGSCSFTPNPIGPLSNSTQEAVVMTVTTQAANTRVQPGSLNGNTWLFALLLSLPGVVLCTVGRRRHCFRPEVLGLALVLVFLLSSCGGGTGTGSTSPGTTTTPSIYTITVVGSPPSVSQPNGSTVTITVQ